MRIESQLLCLRDTLHQQKKRLVRMARGRQGSKATGPIGEKNAWVSQPQGRRLANTTRNLSLRNNSDGRILISDIAPFFVARHYLPVISRYQARWWVLAHFSLTLPRTMACTLPLTQMAA